MRRWEAIERGRSRVLGGFSLYGEGNSEAAMVEHEVIRTSLSQKRCVRDVVM